MTIRRPSALLSLCLLLAVGQTFSQSTNVPRIDTGNINGANYRISIPAQWNKNGSPKRLMMYAHGYEPEGSPAQLNGPNTDDGMKIFLERGYAVARSAYRKQGWALPEGVEDTEALRQYFVKKYGKPDSTLITGHSMGGGVTIATIETYPQHYQGGLALCPLSSRPYVQTKAAFDINAVFSALFPNALPPLAKVMNGTAPPLSFEVVSQKIQGDTVLSNLVAKRFDLKLKDLPMVIMFNDGVLRGMAKQSGGNPYDNTNTVYSGFPNDWELNQKVERLVATPGADRLLKRYDRTGQLSRPLVMMHTLYDQLITPTQGVVNYDNLVHQMGKEQYLTVFYTNGQGHCVFTPQQTGVAFDALRGWIASGKKPTAGAIR